MLRLVLISFGKLWQVYKTSVIWLRICLTTTFSFGIISKQQKTHDSHDDDLDNYDNDDHDHHWTTLPPQTQAEKSPRWKRRASHLWFPVGKDIRNQIWHGNITTGETLGHRQLRYDFLRRRKIWTVPLILQFNIYVNVLNQPGLPFLDCYSGFPPLSGTCLITQPGLCLITGS